MRPSPVRTVNSSQSDGFTVAVTVNGEDRQVPAGASVEELLTLLGFDRRGLAVAVGDEVVPRTGWGQRVLSPGDRVEILTIAQGG